mmetsp:Transcript_7697/g.11586  ORF Transcript_7697/g.11586 Transcript_7697/m.11586 type:complete len:112 (+) Transcript_7697:1292-1627(+)
MSIAAGGFDFKHAIVDCEECHIERTASQVENQYVLFFSFFVDSIGDCGCCWLINHAFNNQASNFPCVFCCLPLSIIEVGWNSDDCSFNFSPKKSLSSFFHFLQDHRTYFFG